MPQQTALRFQGRSWTYRELNDRVNRLAGAFKTLGIGSGRNVAVLSSNTPEMIETTFALSRLGAPFVPINTRLSVSEMLEYGVRMQCRTWVVSPDFAGPLKEMIPALQASGAEHFIMTGRQSAGEFIDYEELIASSMAEPERDVRETDCFWIMATGGTTGRLKGALKNHREWVLSLLCGLVEFGLNREDKSLVAAPLCYGAGSYMAHMTLYAGGMICLLPRFEPEEVLRTIQEEGITALFLVPTMYNQIVNLPPEVLGRFNLASVRTLISAGSPLLTPIKEALLDLFPGGALHEYYGASDLSIVTDLRPVNQRSKIRSVGRPVLGMEVRLLNDQGTPVAPGEVGELFCHGHGLPMGYFGESQGPVSETGWGSAGDLAVMDEEGFISIVDRKKDMIISGGINIYPAEIEEILSSHPQVLESAVIGIPSDQWGEVVKAFVVLKEGGQVDSEELLQYCQQKLARYKLPKSISLVADLPKNTAGKILKRQIREQYWQAKDFKVS